MSEIKTIEIQKNDTIYYPHTDSSVVRYNDTTVEDILDNLSNSGFYYCGTTTGTNDYTVTNLNINSYNGEFVVIVKIGTTNTGACTLKINDLEVKNILDNSGNAIAADTLKAGSMYQLFYNGTNFFILTNKGGGGGNLIAKYLLSGYYGEGDNGRVDGTMVNRGAVTATLNAGGSYTIPDGYHNGSGKVTANSLKSQTSATATAAKILSGYTAWVNGSKLTGTATIQSLGGAKFLSGTKKGVSNDNGYLFYQVSGNKGLIKYPSYLEIECSFTPKYIFITSIPYSSMSHMRTMIMFRNDGQYFYDSTKCDCLYSGGIYTNGASASAETGYAYSLAQSPDFNEGNIYRIPAPKVPCFYIVIG